MLEIRHRILIHHDLYKSRKEIDLYAKDMEKLAERRAQQLLHADRLVTLGTMSAGIMHEINNPTTFISGNVQLLKNKFLPVIDSILKASPEAESKKVQYILEELPKMCEGILNGVFRIKKITDGLKSFSSSSENKNEVFPINQVINNALFFSRSTVPKSVDIVYTENESTGDCIGDKQQLEQVVINLIINSSHALEETANPTINLEVMQNDKQVVRDNGGGIPEKIWDPFFTTKPKGKGTGLGLAICKEIIEAHQGDIAYKGSKN